jgi:hypothetical protein
MQACYGHTGKSKGSAFLWYATRQHAKLAMLTMHGQLSLPQRTGHAGRPLTVRPALQSRKTPAPQPSDDRMGMSQPSPSPRPQALYLGQPYPAFMQPTLSPWLRVPPLPAALNTYHGVDLPAHASQAVPATYPGPYGHVSYTGEPVSSAMRPWLVSGNVTEPVQKLAVAQQPELMVAWGAQPQPMPEKVGQQVVQGPRSIGSGASTSHPPIRRQSGPRGELSSEDNKVSSLHLQTDSYSSNDFGTTESNRLSVQSAEIPMSELQVASALPQTGMSARLDSPGPAYLDPSMMAALPRNPAASWMSGSRNMVSLHDYLVYQMETGKMSEARTSEAKLLDRFAGFGLSDNRQGRG